MTDSTTTLENGFLLAAVVHDDIEPCSILSAYSGDLGQRLGAYVELFCKGDRNHRRDAIRSLAQQLKAPTPHPSADTLRTRLNAFVAGDFQSSSARPGFVPDRGLQRFVRRLMSR